MFPLGIISFIMWTLIINRLVFFRTLYIKNMSRAKAGAYIREGVFPKDAPHKGAVALLVKTFIEKKSNDPDLDSFILDQTVMEIVSSLDRHLALITVLAGIAPLCGLLGTVVGMINTFDIISVFGTGNAKAMAGGISEALITTQTGLLVAIPGLYLSNFLRQRAHNLKQRVSSEGIYLKRFL